MTHRTLSKTIPAGALFVWAAIVLAQNPPPGANQGAGKNTPKVYCDSRGRFTFEVPDGWTVSTAGSNTVATNDDFRIQITIVESTAAASSAIQSAAQMFAGQFASFREKAGEARGKTTLSGGHALWAAYDGRSTDGTVWSVRLIGSELGWIISEVQQGSLSLDASRADRITSTFNLTTARQEDTPAQSQAGAAARNSTSTSNPPNTDNSGGSREQRKLDSPAGGPTESQGIAGQTYRVFSVAHVSMLAYGGVTTDYAVLFPDGSAIGALPDEGLDGFNLQAYILQWARKGQTGNVAARYQILADRVEFVYPNYVKTYAPQSFLPLCQCNGTKLSGVFGWDNLMVQFSPDGSFIDRGALARIVFGYWGAPQLMKGQYATQNNTLYLKYADGRVFRTSFAGPAAQEASGAFDWIAVKQQRIRRVQ